MAKTKKKPAKVKKAKPRRPKQQRLPGMEPGGHRDIDQAGDVYYDRKLDHKELTGQLKDAKVQLIEKMIEHDLLNYETPDGLVIQRTSKNEIKCKKKDDAEEPSDGEG